MEKLIKKLEGEIKESKKMNDPGNVSDWGRQQGILLSRNEIDSIVMYLKHYQKMEAKMNKIRETLNS